MRQRCRPRNGASRKSTRCARKGRRGEGDGDGGPREGTKRERSQVVRDQDAVLVNAPQGGRRADGEGEPRLAKAVVARVSRRSVVERCGATLVKEALREPRRGRRRAAN